MKQERPHPRLLAALDCSAITAFLGIGCLSLADSCFHKGDGLVSGKAIFKFVLRSNDSKWKGYLCYEAGMAAACMA